MNNWACNSSMGLTEFCDMFILSSSANVLFALSKASHFHACSCQCRMKEWVDPFLPLLGPSVAVVMHNSSCFPSMPAMADLDVCSANSPCAFWASLSLACFCTMDFPSSINNVTAAVVCMCFCFSVLVFQQAKDNNCTSQQGDCDGRICHTHWRSTEHIVT